MNLEPIMQSVAEALRVDHLTPDETGRYVVRFDNKFDLHVRPLERSSLLFEAGFGPAPSTDSGSGGYWERVLTRSLLHCREGVREVVSLDPKTAELRLHRIEGADGLTPAGFLIVLEEFVNAVEGWFDFLTDSHTSHAPPLLMRPLMP